jgi:hypothetical protein
MVKTSMMEVCWARSAVAGKSTAGQTKITSTISSMQTAAAQCNFVSTALIIHLAGAPNASLMHWICLI